MIESLIISLALTLIIEVSLTILASIRDSESLSTIVWVNCITNPIVVFTTNLTLLLNNSFITNITLAILEICVVFVEGFLLKKHLKKLKYNPYLFALYLNGISFGIGLLLSII